MVGQTAAATPSQTATAQDTVRVFAQGDSSRLAGLYRELQAGIQ